MNHQPEIVNDGFMPDDKYHVLYECANCGQRKGFVRARMPEISEIAKTWGTCQAIRRLTVGDAGMRRLHEAQQGGAEQMAMWEGP